MAVVDGTPTVARACRRAASAGTAPVLGGRAAARSRARRPGTPRSCRAVGNSTSESRRQPGVDPERASPPQAVRRPATGPRRPGATKPCAQWCRSPAESRTVRADRALGEVQQVRDGLRPLRGGADPQREVVGGDHPGVAVVRLAVRVGAGRPARGRCRPTAPQPIVSTASLAPGAGIGRPAYDAGLATIRLTTTERTADSLTASVELEVYGAGSRSSGACSSVWREDQPAGRQHQDRHVPAYLVALVDRRLVVHEEGLDRLPGDRGVRPRRRRRRGSSRTSRSRHAGQETVGQVAHACQSFTPYPASRTVTGSTPSCSSARCRRPEARAIPTKSTTASEADSQRDGHGVARREPLRPAHRVLEGQQVPVRRRTAPLDHPTGEVQRQGGQMRSSRRTGRARRTGGATTPR